MTKVKNNKCPVCKITSKLVFFSSGNQPVNENVLFKNKKSALNSNKGEVTACLCEKCNYAFNSSFSF